MQSCRPIIQKALLLPTWHYLISVMCQSVSFVFSEGMKNIGEEYQVIKQKISVLIDFNFHQDGN